MAHDFLHHPWEGWIEPAPGTWSWCTSLRSRPFHKLSQTLTDIAATGRKRKAWKPPGVDPEIEEEDCMKCAATKPYQQGAKSLTHNRGTRARCNTCSRARAHSHRRDTQAELHDNARGCRSLLCAHCAHCDFPSTERPPAQGPSTRHAMLKGHTELAYKGTNIRGEKRGGTPGEVVLHLLGMRVNQRSLK